MTLSQMLLLVFALGAIGGIVRAIIGGFMGWKYDDASRLFTLGTVGDILVGGVASLVVWAFYGPQAGLTVKNDPSYAITFSQCAASFLVGMSGAQILKLLADKHADAVTKVNLTKTAETLLQQNKKLVDELKRKK